MRVDQVHEVHGLGHALLLLSLLRLVLSLLLCYTHNHSNTDIITITKYYDVFSYYYHYD